jgi:hypothetical protein
VQKFRSTEAVSFAIVNIHMQGQGYVFSSFMHCKLLLVLCAAGMVAKFLIDLFSQWTLRQGTRERGNFLYRFRLKMATEETPVTTLT